MFLVRYYCDRVYFLCARAVWDWVRFSSTPKAVRRNFFQGGGGRDGGGGARLSTIFEGKRKRGGEGPERGEVVEGWCPPSHTRELLLHFFRLKLNDLVHTLGGFFGKILNKNRNLRRKYIFMENVCFLH